MRALVRQYRGLPRPIYILFVSKIVDASGCFVFPLLTLVLTDKIGLTGAQAGLVIGGIGALSAPALLLGGRIADRLGRKPAILMFAAGAIVLYAVCGLLPPSPAMLVLVVAGITLLNASGPAHDALVADLTTPEQRQAAYGLLYLGWNIGFAAGPAIGGFLLARHLGIMFLADAATALAALLLVMFLVPEVRLARSGGGSPQPVASTGAAGVTAAGATAAAPAAAAPAAAAVTAEAAGPAEAEERDSILSVLLRRPVLLILSVVLFGYSLAYSQWGFLLPMHLSRTFPESGARLFGLIAGLNGLTVMVFNPIMTLLLRRSSHPRGIWIGGLLYAAGFGLLALASSIPGFFVLAFVFTLGEIANAISTMPFIMSKTPGSHRGRMSGAMQLMMGTGSSVGPIAVGALLSATSIPVAWAAVGGVSLVSSLLVGFVARAERKHLPSLRSLTFLCWTCVVLVSCSPADNQSYVFRPCDDNAAPAGAPMPGGTLTVTQWAYMIQNDVSAVAGTTFDLIVMDYTKDGTESVGEEYSTVEMAAIKDGGGRTAIAYLSIGEAEDYRWYFDPRWTDNGMDDQPDRDAPCWLCRTNPEWAGNYKVQYWSDAWQTIVLAYLDKIIDYGFDGVYLDVIDGFEYWSDPGNGEGYHLSEAEAAARMVNLVKRIAAHARARDTAFLIIPQNGESILESAEKADYLSVINGIGIEDLFYSNTRIPTTDSAYRITHIDQVTATGKPALVVDYVYGGEGPPGDSIVQDFLDKVYGKSGYYPYAARTSRELDDLVILSGQGE